MTDTLLLPSQVAEHTWGLDVKTFLGDYANWDNKRFHELLQEDAWNYRRACPLRHCQEATCSYTSRPNTCGACIAEHAASKVHADQKLIDTSQLVFESN